MLNWAARYFPILRTLKPHLAGTDSLLEIGSGPVGIGHFHPVSFVGCDISFPFRPKQPMVPVMASATALPFASRSFAGVVVSDVLEHVPHSQRMAVVWEALRVVNKIAIFGFPSGAKAFEYDTKLAVAYKRRGREQPEWLQEHLQYQPFPTEQLFEGLPDEWMVSSFDNENVVFHNWVMRREMHRAGAFGFRVLLAAVPGIMESILQLADRAPCYRKIVVVQRR